LISTKIKQWNGSSFVEYPINTTPPKRPYYTIYDYLPDQSVLNSEKFNNWEERFTPNPFGSASTYTLDLISHFSSVYDGIRIRNSLENTGVNAGNIGFKDPWLLVEDTRYPNPAGGYYRRNQDSIELSYKFRPSPFAPDYSTNYSGDVYQGVFLNQSNNQDR